MRQGPGLADGMASWLLKQAKASRPSSNKHLDEARGIAARGMATRSQQQRGFEAQMLQPRNMLETTKTSTKGPSQDCRYATGSSRTNMQPS